MDLFRRRHLQITNTIIKSNRKPPKAPPAAPPAIAAIFGPGDALILGSWTGEVEVAAIPAEVENVLVVC
jgi:hypothetical protein